MSLKYSFSATKSLQQLPEGHFSPAFNFAALALSPAVCEPPASRIAASAAA